MKRLIQLAVFALVLAVSIPATGATETKCTGDATRLKPPIPNYPTHIRNVVWRNKRALCQQPSTLRTSQARPNSNETNPSSSAQPQPQKQ